MLRSHTASIAALISLLAVSSANAQQRASATIDSFRGLAWGSTTAMVLEAFGEPEEDSVLDGGLQMLAFRDSLVGRPSVVLFGILPDHGLVKGQEVITALEGQECVDQMRSIHTLVDLQYPLIRPTEEAINHTNGMICEAVKQGSAFWHRQWIDEVTGSVVSVRLDSGSTQINLIFESLIFREWIGAPVEVVSDESAAAEDAIGQVP
jgi:hypothetical protein